MKKHLASLLCLLCIAPPALAQNSNTPATRTQQPTTQNQPSPPQQQPQDGQDEVLRVSSTLVQTDLTVFDRNGRFVEGLRPEQLELKVDGKPQSIDFFERVTAGSADEARRIAAARGEQLETMGTTTDTPVVVRPRSITFYADDLNLTPQGISRAREVLINFIDKQLQPGTQVLIVTSSGQLRFYQQFTDDREVLRAAARRINYQAMSQTDIERPVMSDNQAMLIDSNDRNTLAYHIQQYLSQNPGTPVTVVENIVRQRARRIRQQAAQRTRSVIENLERAVSARSNSSTAARQIMFFISEGFVLDRQEADITYRLQRAVDAAARSGTVVYTLDARGLASGAPDASDASRPSLSAPDNLAGGNAYAGADSFDDLRATQESLRTIAEDTGGRALLNNNALEALVQRTLDETANYYLIAWRPNLIDEKTGRPKFRKIEVRVKDRNDVKVRVRRGFFTSPERDADRARTNASAQPSAPTTPNGWLNRALNSSGEQRDLNVAIYPTFTNVEAAASVATVHVQLDLSRLVFANQNGKSQADVDVACVLLDESGKAVGSDGRTLTVSGGKNGAGDNSRVAAAATTTAPNATPGAPQPLRQSQQQTPPQPTAGSLKFSFSFRTDKPGMYQFRVAARDRASGLTGTRFGWLSVPELKPARLSLGTLLVAAASSANSTDSAGNTEGSTQIKIDRRFDRRARLLMQLYLYNAARRTTAANGQAAGQPDVTMEIKVLRGATVAINAPAHQVSLTNAADLSRILYTAQIPLAKLAPGAYILQVTATDRVAKSSQMREITFTVE